MRRREFVFALGLATLGMTLPALLIARTDEVIE